MVEMAWKVPSAVYSAYVDACSRAATNNAVFRSFRDMEPINAAIGTVEQSLVDQMVRKLESKYPNILSDPKIRHIDSIGLSSDNCARLSNRMVWYVSRALDIIEYFGPINNLRVAEIGVGWGGLAAVLYCLSPPASYTIYDLPEVCELVQRYFRAISLPEPTSCLSIEVANYDLVISDHAIGEFTNHVRLEYLTKIFGPSKYGTVTWGNTQRDSVRRPDGVLSTNPNDICEWLQKVIPDKTVYIKNDLPPCPQLYLV